MEDAHRAKEADEQRHGGAEAGPQQVKVVEQRSRLERERLFVLRPYAAEDSGLQRGQLPTVMFGLAVDGAEPNRLPNDTEIVHVRRARAAPPQVGFDRNLFLDRQLPVHEAREHFSNDLAPQIRHH
jgi:hypothetical protein